jgi:hypothetical protein
MRRRWLGAWSRSSPPAAVGTSPRRRYRAICVVALAGSHPPRTLRVRLRCDRFARLAIGPMAAARLHAPRPRPALTCQWERLPAATHRCSGAVVRHSRASGNPPLFPPVKPALHHWSLRATTATTGSLARRVLRPSSLARPHALRSETPPRTTEQGRPAAGPLAVRMKPRQRHPTAVRPLGARALRRECRVAPDGQESNSRCPPCFARNYAGLRKELCTVASVGPSQRWSDVGEAIGRRSRLRDRLGSTPAA